MDRQTQINQAASEAAFYLLSRMQCDPDLYYVLGPDTESFRRLCKLEAVLLDKPLAEVEQERRQTYHHGRRPQVVELRERIRELEDGR